MKRKSILISAGLLVFLLNLQMSHSSDISDGIIRTRRMELVNMKVSQWKPFLKRLDYILRSGLDVNVTCLEHMRLFVYAMLLRSDAGLELLDSLGSLPNGILQGSLVDTGSYKGCFSANVTDKNGRFVARRFCDVAVYSGKRIAEFPQGHQNQQAQAKIFAFTQSLVKIGVCIPSSCSAEDSADLINGALSEWNLATVVVLCDHNEAPENTPVLIILILGSFVATVTVATLLDVIIPGKSTSQDTGCTVLSTGKHFMARFRTLSVLCTLREAFRLGSSNADRLDVFNGLRALTMVWVIALHTHLYIDEIAFGLRRHLAREMQCLPPEKCESIEDFRVWATVEDPCGVSSGFMQWMTVWKRPNNESGKACWFAVVIRRYFRMFPLVATTVCLHYLHRTSGYGPTWAYYTKLRMEVFAENWHQYLLGTLNFLGWEKIWSPQQWYTSTDFQVFVFMLFFTMRLKRTGRTWPILIVMVLAVLCCYVENYTMQYPPGNLFAVPLIRPGAGGEHVYRMPYSHVPSYSVGIIAGFWYTTREPRPLPRHKVAFLWVAALCSICIAQFGSVFWTGHAHPSPVTTALYAATHRGLFSVGIAWVIYACLTDRAGLLTTFLSWPGWAPLSRLSFSTYMIQDIVLQYQWTSLTSRVDGGYYFIGILVAGNCVASVSAAFFLHALFEKPVALLASLLEEHFLPQRCQVPDGRAVDMKKHDEVNGVTDESCCKKIL